MRGYTVSKNHTVVFSLFFSLMLLIGNSANSAENTSVSEACVDKAVSRYKCKNYESNAQKYDLCLSKAYSACGGSVSIKTENLTCKEAQDALRDVYKEFNSACRKARMGTGFICIKKANKCIECNGADGSDLSDTCDESDDGASGIQQKFDKVFGGNGVSTTKTTLKYKYCPSMAAEDLKDLREEVKDKKNDVKDIKEEIAELKEKINELKNEYEEIKQEQQ